MIFVHIFSREYEDFPFFVESSRPVHRGYFRLKVWHFKMTGSTHLVFNSWPKICDIYFASASFNGDSGVPSSSAQKVFLPTVQLDLLIHFYFFWEVSSSHEKLFSLQRLFWSRTFPCFGLFQHNLSSCKAAGAISTFQYTARALDIICLSWCRIWQFSVLAV